MEVWRKEHAKKRAENTKAGAAMDVQVVGRQLRGVRVGRNGRAGTGYRDESWRVLQTTT